MNNEMIPLMSMLVQSEDLKKQSERIIQEVRISTNAKKIADELIASIYDSDKFEQNLQLQKEQYDKLMRSIDLLNEKLDRFITKFQSGPNPGVETINAVSSKEEKKSSKK